MVFCREFRCDCGELVDTGGDNLRHFPFEEKAHQQICFVPTDEWRIQPGREKRGKIQGRPACVLAVSVRDERTIGSSRFPSRPLSSSNLLYRIHGKAACLGWVSFCLCRSPELSQSGNLSCGLVRLGVQAKRVKSLPQKVTVGGERVCMCVCHAGPHCGCSCMRLRSVVSWQSASAKIVMFERRKAQK